MANVNEKGTATQGVKANGEGDPRAHFSDLRSEQAQTDGMMGARGADSQQPGKPYARPGQVRKDDPDPYGAA